MAALLSGSSMAALRTPGSRLRGVELFPCLPGSGFDTEGVGASRNALLLLSDGVAALVIMDSAVELWSIITCQTAQHLDGAVEALRLRAIIRQPARLEDTCDLCTRQFSTSATRNLHSLL